MTDRDAAITRVRLITLAAAVSHLLDLHRRGVPIEAQLAELRDGLLKMAGLEREMAS